MCNIRCCTSFIMKEGKILKIEKDEKREWSSGLSSEVVVLIKNLRNKEQAVVVDCGAGEGRHSLYALQQGIGKVIAIEKDPAQINILMSQKEENNNLEIIKGDALEELGNFNDNSINGIIDSGMSHYFKSQEQRIQFAELVRQKLVKGGLYSVTHFSKNEVAAKNLKHSTLEELKILFPDVVWDDSIMSWREETWESEGNKHFAYKAVLRKR